MDAQAPRARRRIGDKDLPVRESRHGTLIDAQFVALGTVARPGLPSHIVATRAAAMRDRAAWLFSFARTPPLTEPEARFPPDQTMYCSYVLIDSTGGQIVREWPLDGTGAMAANMPLPETPTEQALRQSIGAAIRAVSFPAYEAGWLPPDPAVAFVRVSQLPEGRAGVVADDCALAGDTIGERVRVISTARPRLVSGRHLRHAPWWSRRALQRP